MGKEIQNSLSTKRVIM